MSVKASAVPHGPMLTIPVGRPVEALLRPVVTRQDCLNADDVVRLTDWRNRFVQVFLTEFQATYERTANWLVETVGPSDTRIVFMVDDTDGRTFGYMGLASIHWESGSFEVDGIVRGADAASGLMSRALLTMMMWAQGQLGLGEARVRVRSDNTAQDFYLKLRFRPVRQVPLRRIEERTMVRWVEDAAAPAGSPNLIHMVWGA